MTRWQYKTASRQFAILNSQIFYRVQLRRERCTYRTSHCLRKSVATNCPAPVLIMGAHKNRRKCSSTTFEFDHELASPWTRTKEHGRNDYVLRSSLSLGLLGDIDSDDSVGQGGDPWLIHSWMDSFFRPAVWTRSKTVLVSLETNNHQVRWSAQPTRERIYSRSNQS